MTYTPHDPYDSRMAAVLGVAHRLVTVAAFTWLRDGIRELHPACTVLRAWTREAEHDHWVFTEVHALDQHGSIIGEPSFVDHVLAAGRLDFSPDTTRHFSDADTIRILGQPGPDGAHYLDLAPESPGVAVFDLLNSLPAVTRLEIAYAAADHAGGRFVPDGEQRRGR